MCFSTTTKKGECICFSEMTYKLFGILWCNKTNYQANILYGHWIGYNTNQRFGKERDLVYSYCYLGRCLVSGEAFISLPNNTNISLLNSLFCGDYRNGIFCSKCKSNYYMHYHTNRCKLGWLYYILSELAPVTVFFVAIIVFDKRPASSSVNGLILFMQLSDSLQTHGSEFIKFPSISKLLLDLYFLLTGIFNMDFLEAEDISFCIWETATTSDLLAFKYLLSYMH